MMGADRSSVLMVDDSETDRLLARLVFERVRDPGTAMAPMVVEATNGVEALELLVAPGPAGAAWPPDLMLADINMPLMGGFELARRVGELPEACRPVRTYLLSSSDDPGDIAQAAVLDHVVGQLVKPLLLAAAQDLVGTRS